MGAFRRLAIIGTFLLLTTLAMAQDGIIASGVVTDDTSIVVPIGDRILIDLGGGGVVTGAATTTSPQPDGRYWNTLNEPDNAGAGITYNSFVDTGNVSIPMSITTGTGYWYNGQIGVNGVGFTGAVGDYPASATIDTWIINTSQSPRTMSIVIPAGTYSFTFWGSRASSGTLTSSIKLSTSGSYTTYNAGNNSTFTNNAIISDVLSDGSTPIVFDVSGVGSSNGFGYFGVIDIKKTGN